MKKLVLNSFHESKGAKFSPFAGWYMPMSYGSSIDEHLKTREKVSIFDVSHMGEIEVVGRNAESFLSYILTQKIDNVATGGALYSTICDEDGGTVDDLIAYKRSDENFLLCVNASNILKDFDHLNKFSNRFDCNLIDRSDEYGQLAIQGPLSEQRISELFGEKVSKIRKMEFIEILWKNSQFIISRTGYTGEDGFEIYCPVNRLFEVASEMDLLFEAFEMPWAGLAARDTLRLEAGFPLYGNELSRDISPIQAGLNWSIDFDKDEFVGKSALLEKINSGIKKKVLFYTARDRRIPRSGMKVFQGDTEIGSVLSGGYSPCTRTPIGTVLIDLQLYSKKEKELNVDLGGRLAGIEICKPVFRKKCN
ncbi:MAG: glycine cleavage system aminomethyltransferase GcvT [Verrucomicrobiota bacterium]|nr:glycine cleavage system aminomethyltransferase GcvT [Verrucomicrobiota bacterium]